MSFNSFNQPWLQSLISKKNSISFKKSQLSMLNFLKLYGITFQILPYPLIIEKNQFNNLFQAGQHLLNAQIKIIKQILSIQSKEALLHEFNLPNVLIDYIDWDRIITNDGTIGRFDIIPTHKDYKFCELNIDPAVNGLKLCDCVKQFTDEFGLDTFNRFISARQQLAEYLKSLLVLYKLRYLVIFSIDFYITEGTGTIYSLYEYIKKICPNIKVFLANECTYPRNLLDPEQGKRTLILRMAMYRDISNHQLLMDIFKSQATIVNKFETEIRSNKKWFSFFHNLEYQKLLNADERYTIKKYVPNTYLLNNNNIQNYLAKKNGYVFKKDMSYGGLDILIGSEHSRDFITKKLSNLQEWVAQDKIMCEKFCIKKDSDNHIWYNVVLGLYYINKKSCGMLVRGNQKKIVVNTTYGGAKMGWAFPITPKERDNYIKLISRLGC